jgi:glycosyltransferase involved in cell wall biosynthesis
MGPSMTKVFPFPVAESASAMQMGKRPRLAIVSTFDDMCGIAGYTRLLMKQIEADFDIEVFDLDQFMMRSMHSRVRQIADNMIKDFCARANSFDFVNIQLEYGTLGRDFRDIVRRLSWIAKAAPALSVTFHTVRAHEPIDRQAVLRKIGRLQFTNAWRLVMEHREVTRVQGTFCKLLRRISKRKTVTVIVHTRRDMRLMRYIHRIDSVYDHPLSFLSPVDAASLRATTTRAHIAGLSRLPENAKIVGVFGFLSEYKGFDTVIRAMHLLPEDHHLLIFGGVHPNEIKKSEKIYPYLRKLLDETFVDRSIFDGLKNMTVSLRIDSANSGLLVDHPKNISRRIHFLGPQTDEGFARGMVVCDHVVLPYLEIGQSASGPMSIALELGCRVIAARNHAFMQFARYHPNAIEFFEIGNHLELAERIMAKPAHPPNARTITYTTNTNRKIYIAANSLPARGMNSRLTSESMEQV